MRRHCYEWPAVVDIPPANIHLPSKQQRPASGSTRPSCTSIIGGFVALVFLQFGFNRAHGYAAPAKHLSSSSRSLRDSRITGDQKPPSDAERTRAAAKARLTLLREEPRSAHQSIVCRTFRYASVSGLLEDAIEHDTQGLDCGEQSCVNGFLQLVEQTCSDGVPVAYTGLWVNEEAPSRVDLDVLGALAAWLQPPPYKRPPPASGVWASQLLELTRPQCWQTRSCVVLDFGCGDGEEKLFPPEHGRGMAEPVELHRPGVVGFGELRFQTRDAADPRAIRAAEAGPFLGMSRAKGKQGGQNEQGSQAHGKGISIEEAKVLERPGRRKAKARRNRVREAKGAPFPMRAAGRCARIPRWSKISSSPRSRSLCSC